MTESDEETKEHPAYPEPTTTEPADSGTAADPLAPRLPKDPLEPTTTIGAIPPIPVGMASTHPAAPPAYQGPPGSGWAGQGQPGYGAPGYAGPEFGAPRSAQAQSRQGAGAPTYGTSALVALAGLVLIIFGVGLAVLGAWTLTLGPELGRFIRDNDIAIFGRQIERDLLKSVFQPMPGILMALGVLELLVGAVILAHRNWARWLGVLLALIGLVVSVIALSAVLALVPGVSVQLVVASTLVVGNAFVLLALIAGGGHFTKRYRGR